MNNSHTSHGFTLIELIMVIVLLGVMAVGISGFIGLSTQTYINVSERDELLASARFAIERLNREIRNAVPNSVRVVNKSGFNCIEFVPIKASTTYLDLPVAPKPPSNVIPVIPFKDQQDNDYQCTGSCNDVVIVYPLTSTDVYSNPSDNVGKMFGLKSVTKISNSEWTLTLDHPSGDLFDANSPTQRLYIAKSPTSYCLYNQQLYRFSNYTLDNGSYIFPPVLPVLMAEHVQGFSVSNPPFEVNVATLQRNASVQISLQFHRDDEQIAFNHTIHIANIP